MFCHGICIIRAPPLIQKLKFLGVAGVGLFCDGFLALTIGLGESARIFLYVLC